MPTINIHNSDCMPAMKQMKDNEFDLAIVDPPYGIGESNKSYFGKKRSKSSASKCGDYDQKKWDNNPPDREYFTELIRVSVNQIIWGVNNYSYDLFVGGRIYWDKDVPADYNRSKGEIAYQSFNKITEYFKSTWNGMIQQDMKNKEIRIHPTQKPVALYKWLLKNYAKPGDKILDTHCGSASIALACHDLGFDLEAYEIDKDYYEASIKRLKQHQAQLQMVL